MRRITFIPFDPATKRSEAAVVECDGSRLWVVKGAPSVVRSLCAHAPPEGFEADTEKQARNGMRVLVVATGPRVGARHDGPPRSPGSAEA